jgi:hypothetical protein
MSSKEVFTCPVSGEPCEYGGHCENTKELMEHPNAEERVLLEQSTSTLPEDVRLILETNYCLNERVAKLDELIARVLAGLDEDDWATAYNLIRVHKFRNGLQKNGDYFKSHFPTDEQ